MNTGQSVTHELAVFLRTRRERLSPGAAGLPERSGARRTPGLRREEVAQLAGVSIDYVVRLEQGRGLNPSPEVLEALASALRLTADERLYLFDLARQRPTEYRSAQLISEVTDAEFRLVRDLSPLPAMLVDYRFDVLAWNPEMAALMPVVATVAPEQRNTIELCLLNPDLREFYLDRELLIREGIADLRAAWAAHPDDNRLTHLISQWCARSTEFRALWELRDVRVNGRGSKRMMHPEVGPLSIDYEVLLPMAAPHQRLVIYRASDSVSQSALNALRVGERPSSPALANSAV